VIGYRTKLKLNIRHRLLWLVS